MENNKWTIYIKSLRLAAKYSLREAGKRLDISAPYLQDLETGERRPTKKIVESLINVYNLNDESKRIIYDAAAEENGILPYDVQDFLKENPEAMQKVIKMMNENNHTLEKQKR